MYSKNIFSPLVKYLKRLCPLGKPWYYFPEWKYYRWNKWDHAPASLLCPSIYITRKDCIQQNRSHWWPAVSGESSELPFIPGKWFYCWGEAGWPTSRDCWLACWVKIPLCEWIFMYDISIAKSKHSILKLNLLVKYWLKKRAGVYYQV